MSKPLLYTYRRCPYAMRARMALLQAGVAYQAHELSSLRDKPPAMLAASAAHHRPTRMQVGFVVLVLPSGTATIAHIVSDGDGPMAAVFFSVGTLHQFSVTGGAAPVLLDP